MNDATAARARAACRQARDVMAAAEMLAYRLWQADPCAADRMLSDLQREPAQAHAFPWRSAAIAALKMARPEPAERRRAP